MDYRHPALGMSMRDMIMELVTFDGKVRPIFRSVYVAEKGDAHFLAYPSLLHDHARDIVTQLLFLLAWLHGLEALTMMTASAQERAKNAPWNPTEMKAISEEDRALKRMLSRAKKMSMYHEGDSDISSSDEDVDVDEAQIQIEFEKEATEEYLFSKASTNHSVTSLDTKEKHSTKSLPTNRDTNQVDNESIDYDDDVSKSDVPSPSKKQKKHSTENSDEQMSPGVVRNMYRYFEPNNIDINTLEVGSVTQATAASVASLHHKDVEMKPPTKVDHYFEQSLLIQEQDSEPSLDKDEPPGPMSGPGVGL